MRAKVNGLLDAAQRKGGDIEVVEELAAPLPARRSPSSSASPRRSGPTSSTTPRPPSSSAAGPATWNDAGVAAAVQFFTDSAALYEEKKRCPMDDVMTVWTKAEIDGRSLTIEEVTSDCLLVLDGGAETTRTVIGRTL